MILNKNTIKELAKLVDDSDFESGEIKESQLENKWVSIATLYYEDYRGDKWTKRFVITDKGFVEL